MFSKILLLSATIPPLMAMEESSEPYGQRQLQQQVLIQKNDLLNQYYDLFLDNFDKLMREGKTAEAKALAEYQEKESIEALNNRFDKNTTFTYEQYRQSQHRKNIEINEHYGANHFRLYGQDTQKLIKKHEDRIEKLQEKLQKREETTQRLSEKEETGQSQKSILREKIDADYVNLREKLAFWTTERAIEKYPVLQNLLKIQGIIDAFYQEVVCGEHPKDLEQANSQMRLILDEINEGLDLEQKNFSKLSWAILAVPRYIGYLSEADELVKESAKEQLADAYRTFTSEIIPWMTEEALKRYPKLQDFPKIIETINTLYQGKPSPEELENARDQIQESLNEIGKTVSQGYHVFSNFYSFPLWFIGTIEDWSRTDPHETLDSIERHRIDSMKEAEEAFIKDTNEQIAKEIARIEFIKTHPDFFKIKARPRFEIMGTSHPDYWGLDFSPIPLGKDVIVGVVDNFYPGEQNFKFSSSAINPDYQGEHTFEGVDNQPILDHGAHVSGIIVGSLWADPLTILNEMTIGVAPEAKFEMLHSNSLTAKSSEHSGIRLRSVEEIEKEKAFEWTPDKMAMTITELVRAGNVKRLVESREIPDIDFSLESVANNPIVNSPARILNMSITFGNFGRFTRGHISHFEGSNYAPGLVASLQNRLGVLITGNDGMDLSTSNQARLLKALARSDATATKIIITTNLMQDGLTLNPSSNIPGDDEYLQRCTLSALGTEVTSSILRKNEDDPNYGEMTGTSMAAPHVSGVAAIVLSNHQGLTPDQLSACLLSGATPLLINKEGIPYEVDTTTAELDAQFDFENEVKVGDILVHRNDWLHGKKTYGQGRVNLEGALKYAEDLDPNGTLQRYTYGNLS